MSSSSDKTSHPLTSEHGTQGDMSVNGVSAVQSEIIESGVLAVQCEII